LPFFFTICATDDHNIYTKAASQQAANTHQTANGQNNLKDTTIHQPNKKNQKEMAPRIPLLLKTKNTPN